MERYLKYILIFFCILMLSNSDYTIEELKQAIREAKEIIINLQNENTKLFKENEELKNKNNELQKENIELKKGIKEAKEIISYQNSIINKLQYQDTYDILIGVKYNTFNKIGVSLGFNYQNYGIMLFYNYDKSFGTMFYYKF